MTQRVRLHVWGWTQRHADKAESAARAAQCTAARAIVGVTIDVGGRCPIPRRDPEALEQGQLTGWAWAVYQKGESQ